MSARHSISPSIISVSKDWIFWVSVGPGTLQGEVSPLVILVVLVGSTLAERIFEF